MLWDGVNFTPLVKIHVILRNALSTSMSRLLEFPQIKTTTIYALTLLIVNIVDLLKRFEV